MSLLNRIKNRIIAPAEKNQSKLSYSQCGEDLIVEFALHELKLDKITYLDIGAHHPTYINNTALFYEKGNTGVCVEPDPSLFENIKNHRSKDVCLNVGIGAGASSEADFYIMSEPTLNTFSKEEADRYSSYANKKIEKVIKLPLLSVNEIIEKHFNPCPDFISLDVEGLDFEILKSFDFNKYRPKIWCIETLSYTEDKTEIKINETIDFMHSKNYFTYGDTYINTIFVDKESWAKR